MAGLFLTFLNMSLTGAYVIAGICIARLALKKEPKIISYCLWAVAGFRLVFPYSIESVFSLIPFKAQPIPTDIAMQITPRIDSGVPFVNNTVGSFLPSAMPTASVNPLQIWTAIGAYGWLTGAVVLLIYGVKSYFTLKQKMRSAVRAESNIYEAENIKSPFVLGVFRPKIYLPTGLTEQERGYIVLHEQTHVRRRDHIVKLAAYVVLCLHWFNPFVWVAFLLMGVDMEMSCDERVLQEMGGETKKDYSRTLLSLATEHRIVGGSPLAFGEGGIKERIKNILNFKKPRRIVVIEALVLVVLLSVGFALNRVAPLNEPPDITVQAGGADIHWDVAKNMWNDSQYALRDHFPLIMSQVNPDDLIYVKNGEQITVKFKGRAPDQASLSEYILRDNGGRKYNSYGMPYDFSVDKTKRSGTWTPVPNFATLLSSDSADYAPGAIIKGYFLVCRWGKNVCEYTIVIRGDAAVPFEQAPIGAYTPRMWFNIFDNSGMTLGDRLELELPQYDDTVFRWVPHKIIAIKAGVEKTLFTGAGIWNVFFEDVTGDDMPDICATLGVGFNIGNNRVIVYDYENETMYEMVDRTNYTYMLSMENGRIVVTKTKSDDGEVTKGELAIIDGELAVVENGEK